MDGPVINKLSPRLSLTLISAKYTHALIMDVFWPGSGEVKSVRGNDSWACSFFTSSKDCNIQQNVYKGKYNAEYVYPCF